MAVFGAASLVASIVDDSGEDRLLEATLDCSSYIDVVSDLPEGFNVVEGVSAIHSTIVHQQGRQGTDDDPESPLRFSKIALLVRPNQSFQVSVGENSPEPTRIGWSSATSNSPVQRILRRSLSRPLRPMVGFRWRRVGYRAKLCRVVVSNSECQRFGLVVDRRAMPLISNDF